MLVDCGLYWVFMYIILEYNIYYVIFKSHQLLEKVDSKTMVQLLEKVDSKTMVQLLEKVDSCFIYYFYELSIFFKLVYNLKIPRLFYVLNEVFRNSL